MMKASRSNGLTFVLTLLTLVSSVRASERPNILRITAEDMSPGLGCYGDGFAITPHIDQLADEGVLYSNAFATAPVCSPSRSCLINGLYAPSQGTHHMRSAFPIPIKMSGFPRLLRSAGYFTSNDVKTNYNSGNYKEITRVSWDESSDTAHWRDRRKGQPFFCIFNLMTSHQSRTMVWPHEKFVSEVQSNLTESEIHDPAKAELPPYYPATPVVRKTVARFYDCVTAMDKQVGAILKQLEDDGLAEDTIVFFYSDHGSGMPRHKRALLDSGMRFWGAVGLTASQSLTPRAVKALTAALSDTAIDVRIESADALARHGHTKESIAVLAAALSHKNPAAVQHAARTIELLGDKARSAVPAMKACDLRMKKIRPPGTSPIVVEPDKDKAMWVLFSTEVFLKRFAEADPSFQTIFNGKDLTGWDGDPKTWHVKDGAICCSGKAGNTWLIWRGGELKDFELRLQFRHLSGNSGVQVRSIEDKKWSVVGYQAEVAAQEQMGLWHHSKAPEKYRFALSNAGEKGHITNDGAKTLTRFAPAEKVRQAFRPGEWNEMIIVGQGPKLIQTVNGVVLSELVDLDAKHATSKGLLAFQDHGNGTEVHYRNIRLKQLCAGGDESQDDPIESGKAESGRE